VLRSDLGVYGFCTTYRDKERRVVRFFVRFRAMFSYSFFLFFIIRPGLLTTVA
jgi:hypothetical protein